MSRKMKEKWRIMCKRLRVPGACCARWQTCPSRKTCYGDALAKAFQAKAGVGGGGYGKEDLVRVEEGPEAMKKKEKSMYMRRARGWALQGVVPLRSELNARSHLTVRPKLKAPPASRRKRSK